MNAASSIMNNPNNNSTVNDPNTSSASPLLSALLGGTNGNRKTATTTPSSPNQRTPAIIRDVWADSLETEMQTIRELVIKYPYVSMDTEFPGVVARPLGNFRNQAEFLFQTLRCNVDLLKIIQLGITMADEDGNMPPDVCTWQFNFKFSLE